MRTSVVLPSVLLVLAGCAGNTGAELQVPHTITYSGAGSDNGALGVGTSTVSSTLDMRSTTLELPSEVDRTWEAIQQTYARLEIPVALRDEATHTLGNRQLVLQRRLGKEPLSRYFRCGSDGMGQALADRYRLRISITTRAVPRESGSAAETRVQATGVNPAVSAAPVQCASNGNLEERIASELKIRLMP